MREGQALGADFYRLFVLSHFIERKSQIAICTRVHSIYLNGTPIFFNGCVPVILARQRKTLIGEFLGTCCVAGRRTLPRREGKRLAALASQNDAALLFDAPQGASLTNVSSQFLKNSLD